jgi:formate-dependent phosphoribosylglycinamide formyltransferase (GAR transformylase)
MKRVLLLATTTGYQIRSFGDAARKLGVALVFASDRCDQLDDPWWDHAIAVRFHDEAASLEAIASRLGSPPDGVLAVGDLPVVLAAQVASRFDLAGNDVPAAAATRDKLLLRTVLRSAGLLTPSFRMLDAHDDATLLARSIGYPVVVKPLALSGSRGVIRANGEEECLAAIARVRRLLCAPDILAERDPRHDRLMVEEFIPGREFAIEGLLTAGVFHPLTIFDKPDPLDGPIFEETIYLTPSREPPAGQRQIVAAVGAAAAALGLRHGPVHAECRVNERGVYVLEVAARPIGGLCSKALRFAGPDGELSSLEEILLRHATGEDVSAYHREAMASGVMMIPIPERGVLRGVEGIDTARSLPHVTDVRITAKTDALLVPLPEGRSYLGFIFASADDAATVERALRSALDSLRFTIERDVPIA